MRYVNVRKKDLSKERIPKLKVIADYWFRQLLLAKADVDEDGYIYCPLIKKKVHQSQMHVCHFIDRQKGILRYSEDNCILASAYSNTVQAEIPVEGHRSLHHKLFSQFLGEQRVNFLYEEAKSMLRRSRKDYIALINNFKDKIEEIDKKENGRRRIEKDTGPS